MNNIKICKYYKHPKTCTYPNSCIEQLLSHPQLCCSKLYYSMGLEEVNEKYKQALDEIEQAISNFPSEGIRDVPQTQMECSQYFLSISEAKLQKILYITNKTKEGNNNG